jgi:putative ABC transport system permease protein
VVVTLGLGMGLNTAMFSLLTALLDLRVPVPNQEEIVNLWSNNPPIGRERSPLSLPDFLDYRRQNQAFEDLAAYSFASFKLTQAGEPLRLPGRQVSDGYFRLVGVQPAIGRTFTVEENRPGANRVAILSHGLWQRTLGGDANILGRTLTLNGESYTVVGVMPAGFWFPWRGTVDVFTPLLMDSNDAARAQRTLSVFGRLKANATVEQAQAAISVVAGQLEAAYPGTNRGWGVHLIRLQYEINKRLALSVFMLFGPVVLVLLIACANVANLLLARASVRAREMAVRAALGAGRLRLIRQLLTETAWYSVLSAGLGLLLASWGMGLARRFFDPAVLADRDLRLDGHVLGFALALAVFTPLLFGLIPAVWGSRAAVNETLKEGGAAGHGGAGSRRWREWLVVSEITLAVLLLILGGQLLQFMVNLQRVEPGFDPRNLLTASIAMPDSTAQTRAAAFWREMLQQVRSVPGVQAAALSDRLPMEGAFEILRQVTVEGCGDSPVIATAVELAVSPEYLAATHIPLRAGRDFGLQDLSAAAPVALVDETFVRRYCNGGDAVGKRLSGRNTAALTIVGVVGDVMHERRIAPSLPHVYVPYTAKPASTMNLLVRTSAPSAGVTAAVRRAILEVDRDQPLESIRTLEQVLSEELRGPYQTVKLLMVFAALALLLAAIGVYSVMSYTVAQRTHEIGVRRALGARPHQILGLVIRQGMGLAGAGLAAGLALAGAAEPYAQLRGSVASILLLFCLASAVLGTAALLACYLPAHRASCVEPMAALRHE